MNKEVLAGMIIIGDEITRGNRIDTNSAWLCHRLTRLGIPSPYRITVGDKTEDILHALAFLVDRATIVIMTGGLGPTHDDRTRHAVARWLGSKLVENPSVRHQIDRFYHDRDMETPETALNMAMVLRDAEVLLNPVGVAPGQWIHAGPHEIILLPGPPAELKAIFTSSIEPRLRAQTSGSAPRFHRFRMADVRESRVAPRIASVMEPFRQVSWSILPSAGQVDIEVIADSQTDERRWNTCIDRLRDELGDLVYTEDDREIEAVVGSLLHHRGQTLAVAESCTGGLLGHRVTSIPGSSEYFNGGIIAYSNDVKMKLLGVAKEDLVRFGAVSAPVAEQMARGVQTRLGSDWGIGITGIAGPGGGTPKKPVGTVHIAVAGPSILVEKALHLTGTREQIKVESCKIALETIRKRLIRPETLPEST